MVELPVCRWRGEELTPGRYRCASPKLIVSPAGVAASTCQRCYCCDHEARAGVRAAPPRADRPTGDVHSGMCYRTLARMLDGPAREWPPGWRDWPVTARAHHLAAKGFYAGLQPYPETRYRGRGAVVAGGGKYLPSAYVTCRMLRSVGWPHPIQVWYLGRNGERDERYERLLASEGVEFVDADRVRERPPWRILNGFELKLFSILHSPFEEVLFLDADSYPVANPDPYFDRDDFASAGGVYFPDLRSANDWTRWPFWGVEKHGPDAGFETGQMLLSKRTAHGPLALAGWYDQHSDWCYGGPSRGGGDYGDKGPHRVAWAQLRRSPVMWRDRPDWVDLSFLHRGPGGEPLFVHRCRNKFALSRTGFYTPQNRGGPVQSRSLPLEAQAWAFFEQLRRDLR